MNERTPAYWPTRILLMVGFIATGAVLALSVVLQEPGFGGRDSILGLPARLVVGLVVATAALTGLAWMIRIFRGPRDDPPARRHRDR